MNEDPADAAARPTTAVSVRHWNQGAADPDDRPDQVAVEAPLEVRFAGRPATVLMRTPGDDEELVRGFLLSEGLLTCAEDLVRMSRPSGLPPREVGNVVDLELVPSPTRPELDRPLYSSSSCGVCGKRSIASLDIPALPCDSGLRVPRSVLASLPDRLRAAQRTFDRTGGVHACGLFTGEGTLVTLREDVGRHNAVDKVVGWASMHDLLPLSTHVLMVSGRISFELAQKAVVAGVPVLVAVGAPSSYAIEVAERYGLTLVGFLRAASMNVYTHAVRVV